MSTDRRVWGDLGARLDKVTTEQVAWLYRVPSWVVDPRASVPHRLSLRRLKWWWRCRP